LLCAKGALTIFPLKFDLDRSPRYARQPLWQVRRGQSASGVNFIFDL
jgi:hypothetical protein